MNEPGTWRPSHRKSEETGQILDRAFDDNNVAVSENTRDDYSSRLAGMYEKA